jgi:hypothetical protein
MGYTYYELEFSYTSYSSEYYIIPAYIVKEH